MNPRPVILKPCLKTFTRDLDKAIAPQETIATVQKRLRAVNMDIYAGARRVDTGRLGIPVYMGMCGADARAVMPTRKQMGKGASPEQARASALMEVMERFAFFSFWERREDMISSGLMVHCGWKKAEELFGANLIAIGEICRSVNDGIDEETAKEVMNLTDWDFYPATNLATGRLTWLPLDWFRMLGEFNGSSAGNTPEESIMQGVCEVVERHACAVADKARPPLPTISPGSCADPVLAALLAAFEREKINIILKDMSGDMPLPVVAALAWDPSTLGKTSEIVFTAGAATSPAKAAIRAVTEVAQLAGDFCSNACYEASGLPKFNDLSECQWLLDGPATNLNSLPSVENPDIREEILAAGRALTPIQAYAVETTNPVLNVPAHYTIAPGLQFRERDRNQSLGLFVGRKIAECQDPKQAEGSLARLGQLIPGAFYLPFFEGLASLRKNSQVAAQKFIKAIPLQPDAESRAMAAFYAGYALTVAQEWPGALPYLRDAASLAPDMWEYANLLGVALYKTGNFAEARACFDSALKINKGSALDLANRGLCNELLGDAESAMRDFEAALNLDPSIAFAADHLAALRDKD